MSFMSPARTKNRISIIFKHLGKMFNVSAERGQTLLQVAHSSGVPLEGSCDGNLACSTCHVICEDSVFRPHEITDRENDLLDQAYGLRPTSRLGCQVKVADYMDHKVFEIPKATRNLAVDGYRPPHH